MNADPRFTYGRAVAGFDEAFEQALVDAITIAIAKVADPGVRDFKRRGCFDGTDVGGHA
jgi:hypothetical protein